MPRPVNPPSLTPARGYSHGIVATGSRLLFVAGQVGKRGEKIAGEFVEQFRQALENVRTVVTAAGGEIEHIARLTIYVTDMDIYLASRKELAPVYRLVFGTHYPVMTAVAVSRLIEPGLLVEIEATAVLP